MPTGCDCIIRVFESIMLTMCVSMCLDLCLDLCALL